MSYDVSLRINTGKEEVTAGYRHNYTCNVWPMLRKAFADEEGIYTLEGLPADTAANHLRMALQHMQNNAAEYIPLNPPNGWGSYGGCMSWLQGILEDCELHPSTIVRVW